MAKTKKRFRKNLLAIQLNIQKHPWSKPNFTRKPQKRVHRHEVLFVSR